MKLTRFLVQGLLSCLITGLTASVLISPVRANDSGDAPDLASDPAADIGDVYLFLDPTDITQTVMIATVREFLVPGKGLDLAAFDENVKFHFEIFNDHVNFISPVTNPSATSTQKTAFLNTIKPNRTIDVTFTKREVGLGPQTGAGNFIPTNLRRTLRQQATVTMGGFTGLNGSIFKTDINGDALLVTPVNLATTAPAFDVRNVKVSPTATMQFFAGQVDDPFFMDVPALNSFLDGIRNGGAPNVGAFARARDTYAGYNTLAIAIRMPTVLLLSTKGPFVGLNFATQRHVTEVHKVTGVVGTGAYVTIDRMGNPLVNGLLIPFDKRNTYNTSTPKGDATLLFNGTILETLKELGMSITPPEPSVNALREMYVAYGDILQLDTTISNFNSPAGAGYDHKNGSGFAFPNGRRLVDDTVDIVLTAINHNMTIGDGIARAAALGGPTDLTTSFPFLGKPNQPLASGSTDPTQN